MPLALFQLYSSAQPPALLDLLNQVPCIKIRCNWILGKFFADHEFVGLLNGVEIVHLRFQHVSVRVFVVDWSGRSVVNAAEWGNSASFALPISEK